MTKRELIDIVASKTNLKKYQIREVIELILETIINQLARKKRIQFRNFGTFYVKHKKSRPGRNPKTGKPYRIPARNVVKFRAGKKMFKKVNK